MKIFLFKIALILLIAFVCSYLSAIIQIPTVSYLLGVTSIVLMQLVDDFLDQI